MSEKKYLPKYEHKRELDLLKALTNTYSAIENLQKFKAEYDQKFSGVQEYLSKEYEDTWQTLFEVAPDALLVQEVSDEPQLREVIRHYISPQIKRPPEYAVFVKRDGEWVPDNNERYGKEQSFG